MAVLTDPDRIDVWADWMREISAAHEPCSITKPELRAAVNALDQWLSDNAASANAAIPLPARTSLTTAQKARLMMLVIRKRYLAGV